MRLAMVVGSTQYSLMGCQFGRRRCESILNCYRTSIPIRRRRLVYLPPRRSFCMSLVSGLGSRVVV